MADDREAPRSAAAALPTRRALLVAPIVFRWGRCCRIHAVQLVDEPRSIGAHPDIANASVHVCSCTVWFGGCLLAGLHAAAVAASGPCTDSSVRQLLVVTFSALHMHAVNSTVFKTRVWLVSVAALLCRPQQCAAACCVAGHTLPGPDRSALPLNPVPSVLHGSHGRLLGRRAWRRPRRRVARGGRRAAVCMVVIEAASVDYHSELPRSRLPLPAPQDQVTKLRQRQILRSLAAKTSFTKAAVEVVSRGRGRRGCRPLAAGRQAGGGVLLAAAAVGASA